jgi:hypothetical protein
MLQSHRILAADSSCRSRQVAGHRTAAAVARPHTTNSTHRNSQHVIEQQQNVLQQSTELLHVQKRGLLLGVAGCLAASWLQQLAPAQAAQLSGAQALFDIAAVASDLVPAVLQLDKSPDQSKYDPAVSTAHRTASSNTGSAEQRVLRDCGDAVALWLCCCCIHCC